MKKLQEPGARWRTFAARATTYIALLAGLAVSLTAEGIMATGLRPVMAATVLAVVSLFLTGFVSRRGNRE